MCPADRSSNTLRKMAYISYTSTVLITSLVCFTASVAFCWKYFFTDFDGSMLAIMTAVQYFGLIYTFIVAILMHHKAEHIFTSLSTIYTTRKCESFDLKKKRKKNNMICWNLDYLRWKLDENRVAYQFLARANNTSEWLWTLYFKYVAVSIIGFISTSLLSVLYSYSIRGDLNTDHFYLIGRFVWANWNSPIETNNFFLQIQLFHRLQMIKIGLKVVSCLCRHKRNEISADLFSDLIVSQAWLFHWSFQFALGSNDIRGLSEWFRSRRFIRHHVL